MRALRKSRAEPGVWMEEAPEPEYVGGLAALHFAARDGRTDVAEALLAAGADVNGREYQLFPQPGPVAAASYTLVGGILLLGGLGYAADQWLDTAPWLFLAGLLAGIVVGFYELVKTAWRR